MSKLKRVGLVVLSVCLAGLSTAVGQSTLHIGPGAGTSCATGCGGDPNLLSGAWNVDIYQNSGGAPTAGEPVLIILGVPSQYDRRMPAMPITGVTSYNPYPNGTGVAGTATFATGGTYGLINPVSNGYFGIMQPGQEVYSFLGLAGANKSNSFTNWAGEDDEYVDLTVTGFAIHVYAVTAELGPNGLINLSLVQKVPKGTYIVAYSVANGKSYAVPFTESGLKVSY
ncbi:MAG TPA: hypothetical protein VGM18_07000 [Candidatus Sulfotelmatobacter sp.]|jgi:hypothetical protein